MKIRNLFILVAAAFVACANISTFCYASDFSSEEEELTGAVPSPVRGIVPANVDSADGELPQSQITLYGVTEVHKKLIFIMAAREGTSPGALRLVCKEWRKIIDEGTVRNQNNSLSYSSIGPFWRDCMAASWGVTPENAEIFQTFLNGRLVFKPDPNSDEGKIELAISDFANPFGGTFDLLACGEAGKYLQFTTDPSVFFAIDKVNPKDNILIAPRFLIEQCISTTAQQFATIMDIWDKDKPVGIFWRWGKSNPTDFDYLSSSTLHEISSRNMWENCKRAHKHHMIYPSASARTPEARQLRARRMYTRTIPSLQSEAQWQISCLFVNQN